MQRMRFLALITSTLFLFILVWLGNDVPVSIQVNLLEPLRTTNAILMGVIGIWIAIVFPRALSDLQSDKLLRAGPSKSNFRRLVKALLLSITSLLLLLVFEFGYFLVQDSSFLANFVRIFRSLSISFFGIIFLMTLWSVILSVIPSQILQLEFDLKERRVRENRDSFPNFRDFDEDPNGENEPSKSSSG